MGSLRGSELLEKGAANKSLLNPLFALHNLLTIAFGIGLFSMISKAWSKFVLTAFPVPRPVWCSGHGEFVRFLCGRSIFL